jgi:hypothetical protein
VAAGNQRHGLSQSRPVVDAVGRDRLASADPPRGLESLLKAKAWLWSMISTGIVLLVLAYAGFLFHADIWKIGLVLVAWFIYPTIRIEAARIPRLIKLVVLASVIKTHLQEGP